MITVSVVDADGNTYKWWSNFTTYLTKTFPRPKTFSLKELDRWCEKEFNQHNGVCWDHPKRNCVMFLTEKDFTFFVMRWS